tara:strand:- start:381 stop:1088 length:708 start_codon:yes stop_codon:yes gene_type:complete
MALPKLNTPQYQLELPSTGGKIKYRPFLVKEQKLLMMAQESKNETEIADAISAIITSCTDGVIDAKNSPLFDVEYVFLQLRAKSVGETADVKVKCPDDDKTFTDVKIKLDDVDVHMTADHTNVVEVTDKIKVIMKYPVLNDMRKVNNQANQVDNVFGLLKSCIHEVHDGDVVHSRVDMNDKDIEEFVDSLNTAQFEGLMNFFNTMPKLRHTINVTNPKTKVKSEVLLEGLDSFLA